MLCPLRKMSCQSAGITFLVSRVMERCTYGYLRTFIYIMYRRNSVRWEKCCARVQSCFIVPRVNGSVALTSTYVQLSTVCTGEIRSWCCKANKNTAMRCSGIGAGQCPPGREKNLRFWGTLWIWMAPASWGEKSCSTTGIHPFPLKLCTQVPVCDRS